MLGARELQDNFQSQNDRKKGMQLLRSPTRFFFRHFCSEKIWLSQKQKILRRQEKTVKLGPEFTGGALGGERSGGIFRLEDTLIF